MNEPQILKKRQISKETQITNEHQNFKNPKFPKNH